MSQTASDALSQFSEALAGRVAAAAPLVVGIEARHGGLRSGILWRDDVVIASEQALPHERPGAARSHTVHLPDGTTATGMLAGRDPSTNVAIVRLGTPGRARLPALAPAPRAGSLAIAIGHGPVARLAAVQSVGPAWHSMAGGRIERRLVLDMRARHLEEGGPVLDAQGRLLGMATAGPRGMALVIPHETIARVVDPLLAEGKLRRGWLGVGLQPVAVPEALRAEARQATGLMVVSLAEDGPAAKAGVLPGDILLTLDEESLLHPRGIRAMLSTDRVGQTVQARLIRAGGLTTAAIEIGARPEE